MLPKILATSVIRATELGDSHGGLYLIDLEKETHQLVLDWKDQSIDFEGRGGERGLRGVAFYEEFIFLASNSEILKLNQNFEIVNQFTNEYLDNIHEIIIENDDLLITSTGFDSIVWFNLQKEEFQSAYLFRKEPPPTTILNKIRNRLIPKQRYVSKYYDPNVTKQAHPQDSTHINSVFVNNGLIYFSGTSLNHLYQLQKPHMAKAFCALPWKTHNGRYSNEFVYFNNTPTNVVKRINPQTEEVLSYHIPEIIDVEDYTNNDRIAKRSFNRGMLFHDDYLIVGSSPSNISVFDIHSGELIKQIQLSKDIKNAIHGIALYPFGSIV